MLYLNDKSVLSLNKMNMVLSINFHVNIDYATELILVSKILFNFKVKLCKISSMCLNQKYRFS